MKKQLLLLTGIALTGAVAAQQTTTVSPDSVAKQLEEVRKDVGELKKLKVTGWIQAQYQSTESRGAANFEGGNFAPNSDKRFTIRRARVKFTYNGNLTQYVLQINATERGINLTEVFAVATAPFYKPLSLTIGMMNRPFGFEIDQTSAIRESPERSRYTQILMPNERDMGAKLTFAPTKGSPLYGLRLDAGMFNGQGAYVPGTGTPATFAPGIIPVLGVNEFDYQKDFIGRLIYYRTVANDKITFGIGASHYNGGNIYITDEVYKAVTTNTLGVKDWQAESGKFANHTSPRVYYGGEGFFSFKTGAGTTTIRGEYITGTQPGYAGTSASPFFLPVAPASQATYVRPFDGMYGYLIHRLGKHEFALKHEWYDPNTAIAGKDILGGAGNRFTAADIRYTQQSVTYTYFMYENVKFMFNYVIIANETVPGTADVSMLPFTSDQKDNVFTVRVQYRF